MYPALYDNTSKRHKEKDVIRKAREKVAEGLDFVENGKNYTFFLSNKTFLRLLSFLNY